MKKKFESLNDQKFTSMENEQMSVLYGGQARAQLVAADKTYADINTSTVTPCENCDDGQDAFD
ncbi:MAG: hypothetical protein LBP85_09920 [Prevotellaceae bacterium]|jgi:hypothetical protein|nr:hypothetical protein [Prevotellaceae bacterium]